MVQELSANLEPNRAGMVVFNLAGQVLLLSAITNEKQWVFPKGHIEKGETPDQTAARECLEEANVVASPLFRIGTSSFKFQNEIVIVDWWSGVGVRQAEKDPAIKFLESDFRNTQWVSVNEALELLSFSDLKTILKKAVCW